jgi:hypothetical protein
MKYLYPEKQFYKTHKMSRAEFLKRLEGASSDEEREQLLMSLYDDEAKQGRRGVLDTHEAVRIVHRKVEEKEKFFKFAKKFGGSDLRGATFSGATFASLKDLV